MLFLKGIIQPHGYQVWLWFFFFPCSQDIYVNDSNLDEAQRRVVRKFLLEARLNGIELPAEKTPLFAETLKKLEDQKNEFRKKVAVSITWIVHLCFDYRLNMIPIWKWKNKFLLQNFLWLIWNYTFSYIFSFFFHYQHPFRYIFISASFSLYFYNFLLIISVKSPLLSSLPSTMFDSILQIFSFPCRSQQIGSHIGSLIQVSSENSQLISWRTWQLPGESGECLISVVPESEP